MTRGEKPPGLGRDAATQKTTGDNLVACCFRQARDAERFTLAASCNTRSSVALRKIRAGFGHISGGWLAARSGCA
jgi:hypothetical protein